MNMTERDEQGNWTLRGVRWTELLPGKTITKKVHDALYGALWKLKDYEDTGYSPDAVEAMEFELEKCRDELLRYKGMAEAKENGWI